MAEDLDHRIDTLAAWIAQARHLVVFTGAGLSTESGLRDFRGPDGVWTRREKGLSSAAQDFGTAAPNRGHLAFVALQEAGRLAFLISQNVDNLHLKSGIRPEQLAELHGNVTKVRCARCGFLMDDFGDLALCPLCQGKLASSVVDFGQALPEKELTDAYWHAEHCDLFIVAGSSLVVMPAADMPRVALQNGARLVIINEGATPLDGRAHLRFHEKTGEVLPRVAARVAYLQKQGGEA